MEELYYIGLDLHKKEMIKKTRPDIVIEEVAERLIKNDKSHFTGKDI